ncbi:alpha-amylase family glycosyl hydrolase [Prevotella sp. HMSC077E09]|uniref:alpha-amylase family glycosyl hydrolase n=1 Tax=Prevotella sp. HMSC077E09 TaxID=1739487 RepID=UPI0008A4CD1B|nr:MULTISPECIES: alpha-amylase family glycosyl hydrolase [unclassified Prevotella]
MKDKIVIYQVLPRLFGNRNEALVESGTIAENGCGKFSSFDDETLKTIHDMRFTHIWFTGILRHATQTDYSAFGLPRQHAEVVKGKAGSPYAIADYYDVDPDLADDVSQRMTEWEELIKRTHDAGMKVIMDFVPNHVAREYKSVCKPVGVRDLGEDDDTSLAFSTRNNFYYCWGTPLDLSLITSDVSYSEIPAKATGNDYFGARPGVNDWYETIKLNYGIDYCDAGGKSYHFDPRPDTWDKMTDILLFWASKGIDGFRCDMAEMVPTEFWNYAISKVKERCPSLLFIGEVYDRSQYRTYIANGFDYLYDKVGMYDCLRGVITGTRSANEITHWWQATDDINEHMLYFLENHDEQRIASDFFAGEGDKAIPAAAVAILMRTNPFMLYSGQEFGERGMDHEGFSGTDGRTTIFDYWSLSTVRRAFTDCNLLTDEERKLSDSYRTLLNIAHREAAVREGEFFDLTYANQAQEGFDSCREYAFLRKKGDIIILVVANFSSSDRLSDVIIPAHAFDFWQMPEMKVLSRELFSGRYVGMKLMRDSSVRVKVPAHGCGIFKFSLNMKDSDYLFNEHHKKEFPPAHTAEHLLNQLMMRMFHCERSYNAHIERKKSKMSFILEQKPTRQQEKEIERRMNELIQEDMPITYELVDRDHVPADVKLDRLPDDASEMLRLVHIGNFDVCPCLGKHVRSTSQIGRFELLGTNWDELKHSFRIRFKVVQ